MRFLAEFAAFAAGAATLAQANTVTFQSLDSTDRTLIWTPSAGQPELPSVEVPGNGEITVDIPEGYIGNAYSVSAGAPSVVGMLAEFTFNGWDGLTYFDVSAIPNPSDHNGVKQIYPASEVKSDITQLKTFSGCVSFPCATAYYHPNDIQTVSTEETDLIVTLGNASGNEARDEVEPKYFPRNYVLGKL
ncbi:DNase1 protein [Xylariomycetidae sp. FL0641]|nr:DNase1 protein [Xylariomycetidae sp. FL0641]